MKQEKGNKSIPEKKVEKAAPFWQDRVPSKSRKKPIAATPEIEIPSFKKKKDKPRFGKDGITPKPEISSLPPKSKKIDSPIEKINIKSSKNEITFSKKKELPTLKEKGFAPKIKNKEAEEPFVKDYTAPFSKENRGDKNKKKSTTVKKRVESSLFSPKKEDFKLANREKVANELSKETLYPIRLNKFVAHCGICARRKAAEMVKEGQIWVNGVQEFNPSYFVQETDEVTHKKNILKPELKTVYILMNKPKGVITTSSDERDRKTVLDLIGQVNERVFPVGRLDRETTGLLILTNDGDLTKKLSHPSHQVKKIYHVKLNDTVTKMDLETITKGLMLDDGKAEVDEVSYLDGAPRNEVQIIIHSGKNRIIRRIFEHLGYVVEKLDRIYYAGLTKKDLPRGRFRFLTEREVIMLKHFTN